MNNIANNKIHRLNLDIGAQIITAFRRRGFAAELTDLLAYRPPPDLQN